jgi:hypothetical protein
MFEYIGVIHVHSVFSDGSGTVKEIVQAARDSEVDFVVLTDHNTLRALDEGYEKWYGKTLLLVGSEINDRQNKNHYLALGIDKLPSRSLTAVEYVKEIKEAGGIGFIAHPHEKRNSMKEHPPFPWTAWESEDFTGIEIWNHMSEWMEGLTEENKYTRFLHPLRSIVAPPKETLAAWDKLSLKRRVVGIGGVDAHAHKVNLLGFFEVEVFPYKVLFKSIRTHLLLQEKIENSNNPQVFKRTKKMFLEALAEGRCFVSNYYHGDAKGFRFFAEADGKHYQMGDSVPHVSSVRLRVVLPTELAEIRLIHNGKMIAGVEGGSANFPVNSEGAYRIEVYLDGKAWIYSNHIRIGI